MSPKITANGRQVGSTYHGGVVRYAKEVITRLEPGAEVISPRRFGSGPVGHAWEQTVLPARTFGDVLYSPANFGPLLHRRHVVTIHDVSPLEHPEWFAPTYVRLFRTLVPRLARNAAAVVTDSEFSRRRIAALLGVDSVVAGAGVSAAFLSSEHAGRRDDTVVVFGGADPRKNVRRVLECWPQVLEQRPEASLIVVGGSRSGWVFDSASEVDRAFVEAEWRTDLSDVALAELLSSAGVAVFASLYEGFGLPALEALAAGAPLVCSDIPPLREFADGLAEFADPLSTQELSNAILRAFEAGGHPSALDAAKAHTWERVASIVSEVIGGV